MRRPAEGSRGEVPNRERGSGGSVCGPSWRFQAWGPRRTDSSFGPESPRAGSSRTSLLARGGVAVDGSLGNGPLGMLCSKGAGGTRQGLKMDLWRAEVGTDSILQKSRQPLSSLGRRPERRHDGKVYPQPQIQGSVSRLRLPTGKLPTPAGL